MFEINWPKFVFLGCTTILKKVFFELDPKKYLSCVR